MQFLPNFVSFANFICLLYVKFNLMLLICSSSLVIKVHKNVTFKKLVINAILTTNLLPVKLFFIEI